MEENCNKKIFLKNHKQMGIILQCYKDGEHLDLPVWGRFAFHSKISLSETFPENSLVRKKWSGLTLRHAVREVSRVSAVQLWSFRGYGPWFS